MWRGSKVGGRGCGRGGWGVVIDMFCPLATLLSSQIPSCKSHLANLAHMTGL